MSNIHFNSAKTLKQMTNLDFNRGWVGEKTCIKNNHYQAPIFLLRHSKQWESQNFIRLLLIG